MASRQEEKELRRKEREAAEAAAAKEASRGNRVKYTLAFLLAILVVGGGVIALTSGGGDDGGPSDTVSENTTPIPPVAEGDLKKAAAAADCVLVSPELEGAGHVEGEVEYKTQPPTSGPHNIEPSPEGVYEPGNEPAKENYVHSLEHGRVIFHYKPGTPAKRISQLETLYNEEVNGTPGYHTLLVQNNTKMEYAVAASAWGQLVGCETFTDKSFDVLRAFRKQYIDKGPERVP